MKGPTMKAITPETARKLRELLLSHARGEKHIGYHVLPERLNALLAGSGLENRYTFHERERMAFFREHVDFAGKSVLDIGCNIGWVLMGALDAGAAKVVGYEGKPSCAEFITRAIDELGERERFEFHPRYYAFDGEAGRHDVALLLNVLHHLGDDYGGEPGLSIAAAKARMLEQLNGLARQVGTLIFQLGFNWKGNRNTCLFEHGTKAEMIDFVTRGTAADWRVEAIGIAERRDGIVRYAPLSATNILRDDALGEFLNRPLFVLRSRHVAKEAA
jgi:SAM-dependent methyltransferase